MRFNSKHEIFKKPPRLHTKLAKPKRLKPWHPAHCLSESQWSRLIEFMLLNFAELEGSSVAMMINIAVNGRFDLNSKEYAIEPLKIPHRYINEHSVTEAWRVACHRKAVKP